jgi:nonsense-mediated mRNA decay protein 3
VICLPQRLFNSMGNIGPLLICFKVNENLYFIDPATLLAGEINSIQFFYKEKASFKSLLSLPRRYTILDLKLEDKKNGTYQIASVQICKEDEIGLENSIMNVTTHLGNILQIGDTVIGYDIKNSNLNDENLDSYSQLQIPDVIIIRKCYDRPGKRFWGLKKWKIERGDDFEEFLDELEEDKEMRGKINLYKDDSVKMDTEEHLEKIKDIPHVGLEELLSNLKL